MPEYRIQQIILVLPRDKEKRTVLLVERKLFRLHLACATKGQRFRICHHAIGLDVQAPGTGRDCTDSEMNSKFKRIILTVNLLHYSETKE